MKRTIALVLIVTMMLPMALLGQEQSASPAQSYNRGIMAAEEEHSAIGWGVGGFVTGTAFSWLGTGVTVLLANGSSPTPRYIPEDVEPISYRSGYREEARRRNRRSAAIPGVIMSTLWTILVLSTVGQ